MNTDTLIPVALDLLVKSTGILLLAFTANSLWRRASAAQRCLIWGTAFVVLSLLPLTYLMQPHWTFALKQAEAPVVVSHVVLPETTGETITRRITLVPAVETGDASRPSVVEILFMVWIAGAGVVLARRLLGMWQVRALRRRSSSVKDERTVGLATQLAQECGIHRRIELRESAEVSVPLTWGVLRPVLLLPSRMTSWSKATWESALRHELGHIRHGDAASRLLGTVVCAALWPHVLVWMAAKAWHAAQEQACDDLVLRAGSAAEEYALLLLHSARSARADTFRHAPVLAMARTTTLETRLSAIVDETRDRRAAQGRTWLAAVSTALLLPVLCGTMQLRAQGPTPATEAAKAEKLRSKLSATVLPQVTLTDSSLGEALELLHVKSKEADPEKEGVRFVSEGPMPAGTRMSLDLKNVPLIEALRYVTELANMEFQIEKEAVVIRAKGKGMAAMVTRSYRVPSGFLGTSKTAKAALEEKGVPFPDGGSAMVVSEGRQLVVKTTADGHDKVEALVAAAVPASPATSATSATSTSAATSTTAATPELPLMKKAGEIIIPRVQFRDATVAEAVDFLKVKSKELDKDKHGVNIVVRAGGPTPSPRITLDLKDVPVSEAIRYVAELAGLKVRGEPYAYLLEPK